MYQLSNKMLINTYRKAINLNLEKDFIKMLEKEMDKRQLERF
ncbi:sporulation histidine kinase inhibitor Sda [Alkalihalobacterium sp. APHAB7]